MIGASGVPLLSGTWGLPGPAVVVSWRALGLKEWHLGGSLPFTYVTPEALDCPLGELSSLRVDLCVTAPRTLTLFKEALGQRIPVGPFGLFGLPVLGGHPGGQFWQVETTLDSPSLLDGEDPELLARFHEEALDCGGLLLIAADLGAYWSRVWADQEPTLEDVCAEHAWIAWVQLGDHSAGVRADQRWRQPWRRLVPRLAGPVRRSPGRQDVARGSRPRKPS